MLIPGSQSLPEQDFWRYAPDQSMSVLAQAWRHEMSSDELREFEANSDEWLNELGYLQQGA
ncbi:hypothetical protein MGMO_70c00270 [Methyloglobulus morosus KoM1]|uniref:Uncharacterized protein n=2 Tax=Methyloglobulus TaxID=1410680 RepID=V5C0Z9_9GAMM|nr:hypothetical protein MGMO_70c00270 [Methyloglobulus morosus KoM1]